MKAKSVVPLFVVLLSLVPFPAQAAPPSQEPCKELAVIQELDRPGWGGATIKRTYTLCLDGLTTDQLVQNHWLNGVTPQVLGYFRSMSKAEIVHQIWGPWVVPLNYNSYRPYRLHEEAPLFDQDGNPRRDIVALSLRENRPPTQHNDWKKIFVLFFLPSGQTVEYQIPYGGGTVYWTTGDDAPYKVWVHWEWFDQQDQFHNGWATLSPRQLKPYGGRIEVPISTQ